MPNVQETTDFDDLSLEEMASRINNPQSITNVVEAPKTIEEAPKEAAPEKEEPTAEAAESKPEADELPEKFKGKSAAEIARSYSELEKQFGKVSSQRSHSETEAAELRNRLALLEQRVVQQSQQPSQQQQQDADPLASLEEEFALEPTKAFKKVVESLRGEIHQTREQIAMDTQSRETANHYAKLKAENPDFVALEPEMQKLAAELAPVLDRRFINTPQFIDRLYTLARGQNIERYTSEALTKAKTASDNIRNEKRSAHSESVQSSPAQAETPFEDLSIEQMAQRLGRSQG